jgi:hypothetical protein
MRAFLAARIPALVRVTSATDAEVRAAESESLGHMILVSLDATLGLFGARIPFVTISTRTALALLRAQETGGTATAPLWALALGAALETPWALPFVSSHGHLQGAMQYDFARTQFVARLISEQR